MTALWRAVEALTIGLVVLLGGAVIIWWLLHLTAKILRRYGPVDDIHIPEPVPKFQKLTPGEVEALRVRAEIRQQRAEAKHAEGHQIEAGHHDRQIKLVSRR